MKNIIYLTYDGLTDNLGQSQILPYIKGINNNKEYKFIIISFEKNKNLALKKQIKSDLSKLKIKWIPLNYSKNPAVFSTLYDLFRLYILLKKICKRKRIDLLHCRSYLTTMIAQKINYTLNIPYIFDMRGFYPDERVDGKIWDIKKPLFSLIFKYFKKKEKELIQGSSYNICLTKNSKRELNSWNLKDLSPIKVIPCCTDQELFQQKNIKRIRTKIGLSVNDLVISYVGSTGTWYMLNEMLDFFKILKNEIPRTKFLFITQDNPEKILEISKKKGIDLNAIKIFASTRKMVPSYIGISNYSIFFIKPVFSKIASSPTKMGEIMSLGIPIICNSGIGDVDEIMNKCMPELLIYKFSEQQYLKTVKKIIKNDIDQNKIIKISKSYFSLASGVNKYLDIYKKILN